MTAAERRLPSIDGIALGLGVVGLFLSRIQAPGSSGWLGLLGLAVFGPPLLRELGLLRDDDEYTRNIRWRAGFHGAMFAGLAIFLNYVVLVTYRDHPEAIQQKLWLFPMNGLRQNLVLIYLISYLIQYWGAARGVFRILLGLSALFLVEFGMGLVQGRSYPDGFLWPALLAMALFLAALIGGAFLSLRRPGLTGRLILGLGLLIVLVLGYQMLNLPAGDATMGWLAMRLGMISSLITLAMLFGILGASLWRCRLEDD